MTTPYYPAGLEPSSDPVFVPNDPNVAAQQDAIFQGFLLPEEARDYFAEAYKTSVVQAISQQVPMGPTGVKVPHWTGEVQAHWVAEGGMKQITKGNFEKRLVVPHKIAAVFVASAEVIRTNPLNYLTVMRSRIGEAIALAFDAAALHNINSPFGMNWYGDAAVGPQYLDATPKTISLSNLPSGTTVYDQIAVNGLGLLLNDGKRFTGCLLDATSEPIFNSAKDQIGRPLFIEQPYQGQVDPYEPLPPYRMGRIIGRPTVLSDNVRGELAPGTADPLLDVGDTVIGYMGDFRQLLWGQVGGLSYSVSDQATLNFGTASQPEFVSLWQHNLVAVMIEAEYGFLLHDSDAFVKFTSNAVTGSSVNDG